MVFENRLKRILDEGYLAFGATIQIPAVALVEIVGQAGFDFTMLDTEHGLYSMETAGKLIRTAQGVNLTPIVRVLKNDEGLILKALDLGARGVVIPHISNKEDAVKAVKACKYSGSRGACPDVRAASYSLLDWSLYQEEADKNTMVFLLIEDLEGANNIEDIVSVEGVDVVFLGPFDMSVSAGYKGDANHPEIQKALDKVIIACRQKAIPIMHVLMDGRPVKEWVEKGVRLFLQRADGAVFAKVCRDFLKSVSHLTGRKIV